VHPGAGLTGIGIRAVPASSIESGENVTAIIAGNGVLPLEIATVLRQRGEAVFIVGIEGEANPEITTFPHDLVRWEKVGRLFKLLKENAVTRLVLAGGVVGRPELKLRNLDFGGLLTLPGMLAAMLGGDNTILSEVVARFERKGFPVISLADLVPELLVEAGANTSAKMPKAEIDRLSLGMEVIHALGAFDIGQACVVIGKRIVAVEGVEGTDGMLQRIVELREAGRLPSKRGGVLVKCMKPDQDERADLPTIGPQTILRAHEAGLVGVGVEAGKTLMVERAETLRLAQEHGVFVFGLNPEKPHE